MDNESKKPCAPVEEEGRDYDALGLFRREGDNETLMAAMGLWEFLPAWIDARRMALVDPDYNRKYRLWSLIWPERCRKQLKRWPNGVRKSAHRAGWNKFQRDTAGLKHQIKGGCTHFEILEADLICMVTGRRRRPDRHGVRASDTTYLRPGGRQDAQRIKRTAYPKVKFVEAYQRITSFPGVLYHSPKRTRWKK